MQTSFRGKVCGFTKFARGETVLMFSVAWNSCTYRGRQFNTGPIHYLHIARNLWRTKVHFFAWPSSESKLSHNHTVVTEIGLLVSELHFDRILFDIWCLRRIMLRQNVQHYSIVIYCAYDTFAVAL